MELARHVSEKIPLFLRTIKRETEHIKIGERFDILYLFQRASMSAVTQILFGDSSGEPFIPYIDACGNTQMVSLEESYMRV